MGRILAMVLVVVFSLMVLNFASANQETRFSFENDLNGWDIPGWAFEQAEYGGRSAEISSDHASDGKSAVKLNCDFPGSRWSAAIVEHEEDTNLRGYKSISADVFIPKEALGRFFKAKIIVTAGSWWFIEMLDTVPLKGGEWTTVTARLDVGEKGEMRYWKCKTKEECIEAHLDKVKRVAIRIEYNASYELGSPSYKGPVYIDNIVIQ